jgi:hypothetical protein
MTDQIVLAYTPSTNMKDWQFGWDTDGCTCYTQRVRFYCTGCKQLKASCTGHKRDVAREPYYNLKTKQITEPPRVYITHHPKKDEWERLKTLDDLKNSPLYVKGL